jgi:uncharacterized membrane protein YccC
MTIVELILLIVAAVCFAASAFRVSSPRVNLMALGLFFWVCYFVILVAQKVN